MPRAKKPNPEWSEVGPGWHPILDDATSRMAALGWPRAISQVKEKFGSLRLYIDHTAYHRLKLKAPNKHGHEWVWRRGRSTPAENAGAVNEIADEAMRKSASICEACGAPGRLYGTTPNGGWYLTRCAECAATRERGPLYLMGDDE